MELMPVTPETISFIKKWSPKGVCEVGAGNGLWLEHLRKAGIKAIGYDTCPKGQSVLYGDHVEAAKKYKEMSLLIIWPPDGSAIQEWIRVWQGSTIILGIKEYRVVLGDCLSDFKIEEEIVVPGGKKGGTQLSANIRNGN